MSKKIKHDPYEYAKASYIAACDKVKCPRCKISFFEDEYKIKEHYSYNTGYWESRYCPKCNLLMDA